MTACTYRGSHNFVFGNFASRRTLIPDASHVDNRPLYDVDPPDFVEVWHSFNCRSMSADDHQDCCCQLYTVEAVLPFSQP